MTRSIAVLAALVGLIAVAHTPPASAQLPPSRYHGQATLNGQNAAGATIVGLINGNNCGSATADATGKYRLDIITSSQKSGCGQAGVTVTFTVNGANASQTGAYNGGNVIQLNLTAASNAPAPSNQTATTTGGASGQSGATTNSTQNLVPQWLDLPLTTSAPQNKTCPTGNSWTFVYWGGPNETQISVAAAACPSAAAYWSLRQRRWLGYATNASGANDSWLVNIGDANFVRGR